MAVPRRVVDRDVRAGEEILTLDEIADRYDGEWILVRIMDDAGSSPRGVIVAHSPDQSCIRNLDASCPGKEHSGGRYQVFQASRYIRTGVELRQAIEELRRTEDPAILDDFTLRFR